MDRTKIISTFKLMILAAILSISLSSTVQAVEKMKYNLMIGEPTVKV